MDSAAQQKHKRNSTNAPQAANNNINSFVTGNSNNLQSPHSATNSSNVMSQRMNQNSGNNGHGNNFQVRKSYIQSRNMNPNGNSQQSRTNQNRVSLGTSNMQLSANDYSAMRTSGMTVSKTRNANDIRTKQLGGVGLTLTQKINATLETDGLPGVAGQQSGEIQFHLQKLSSAAHPKGRSESRPSASGVVSLPKAQNGAAQNNNTNQDVRASQMHSDRNTLNAISHQDGGKGGRAGSQFATISSNRNVKPQFNQKHGMDPLAQSKGSAQMQNMDATGMVGSSKPRGGYGSTRNAAHEVRSMDPVGKSLTQHPMLNVPNLGGGGPSTTNGNTTGYLTKPSASGRKQGQQPLSLVKHGSTSLGQNHLERRSLDQKGFAKDYYQGGLGERQSATNIVGSAKGQGAASFSTTTHNHEKDRSSLPMTTGGSLTQKKTVSSRTGMRRNQYNNKGGGGTANWGVVNEEVPYPPNTSSNQMKTAMALNAANSNNNQSMSLTRNTSQLRTANLLGYEDGKKHTNSQTIQAEPNESKGTLTKNLKKRQEATTLASLNDKTLSMSQLKEAQSPEQSSQLRKVRMQSAQRKKQLQGMARNKVMLDYNSQSQVHKQSSEQQSLEQAVGHGLAPNKHQRKRERESRMSRVSDLLVGGPQGASHTLQLEGALSSKNKEETLTAQLNRPTNSVKHSSQTQSALYTQPQRNVSGRKSTQLKDRSTAERDESSMQRSQIPGGYNSVAGRIALIAKKQGNGGQRISSQDPEPKKQALASTYAKTNSGLRAGSFRNQNGQNFITESRTEEANTTPQGHKTGYSPKNNNFVVSPRTANTAQIATNKSKNFGVDDTSHRSTLKPQYSSKLIKSVQGNPFGSNPLQKDSSKLVSDEILNAEQLRPGASSSTSKHAKDSSGARLRPQQPRVSDTNIPATRDLNRRNESDLQDEGSIRRHKSSITPYTLTDTQNSASENQDSSEQQPRRSLQTSDSKKQYEMLPSTGGSDEALPKPHSSNHTSNRQKKSQRNTTQDQSSTQGSQQPGKEQPTEQMFNVNYQVPDPVLNPLKDFEPAKFASKTHGLITSYAANTHQGIQRNYNEDRVSIILNMTRPSTRKDVPVWPKCSYFAIYDGHGGSDCSDFLKDQLHLIIINQPSFPKDPAQALTTGCLEAERRFIELADRKQPMHERSGSCGIVVLIVGKECYVANVGDSRAIMSADKGKKLFLLSRDHRPNEEYEVQRIVKNGGGIYQTQSIQQVQVPGQDQPQQHYVLGPHRVIPGRLSVSRTFGDIEAKNPKYGGKEGVIIAQPEISQFTVRQDFHDFIVLGCDGIFDRLSNQQVLDTSWDTINSIKSNEIKQNSLKTKTVHQVSGSMADSIIKHAAIERSLDNLTIVIVSFENLQTFIQDRPQPTLMENHLFQIKEVESGATSTLIQPTPGLPENQLQGAQKLIGAAQGTSPRHVLHTEQDSIPEVRTEEIQAEHEMRTCISHKKKRSGCRTTNQGSEEKEVLSNDHETMKAMTEKPASTSILSTGRRKRSGNNKPDQPLIKQTQMTRSKLSSDIQQLCTRNSERPIDAAPSQRRRNEILPKLPQAQTLEADAENTMAQSTKHGASHLLQSPNSLKQSADLSAGALLSSKLGPGAESPKPLKPSQAGNYRFSKTTKQPFENTLGGACNQDRAN